MVISNESNTLVPLLKSVGWPFYLLVSLLDVASYLFMLVLMLQASFFAALTNALLCYAAIKEIGALTVTTTSTLRKLLKQKVEFFLHYHASMTAFLVGHYGRHFSRLVVLFLGGNVPTNCYLICYLLYDSSSSNTVQNRLSGTGRFCLILTVILQLVQLFGLLLPVIVLNGSLARGPFRFVHQHCLMVGHHSLVVFSSSGRLFNQKRLRLALYSELLAESGTQNGHFGISVPWFGRLRQWTVLEVPDFNM